MLDTSDSKQNTEAAILAAAEAEFLEKGYAGARTVNIARRAGVTHSMLHYYFRTKELIFRKIVNQKLGVIAESVLKIFEDTSLPLKERLVKGISAHFDMLVANPLLPRFLVTEVNTLDLSIVEAYIPKATSALKVLSGEVGMDIRQLILDILSLNAFPFLMMPLIEKIGLSDGESGDFLEKKKQENITVILKRLGL